MDECPLCGATCLVSNNKPTKELRKGDIFICWDCLIQWPTTGRKTYKAFTGSVMTKAHS
jgi:hypothetical protein